ncbi:E3 ubiquitin ligase PQT3-like [Camellia lanceoleosa]|uniref:E3 ubiquitin ligase PQT3-like n=1 Tax=Camellia lanceoleosa TaxID=1840588 RepID=A0ACC0H0I2_9ERIC|nr:E3 ubiquitin ligase PQT3-like [Camellia lanceoleosa]
MGRMLSFVSATLSLSSFELHLSTVELVVEKYCREREKVPVAVLKPNETAFEKEMDGLPSTRSVGDLPPEFHCSLCKQVMKDALLTSYHRNEVKFAGLTLDTVRMMQCLE